MVASRTGPADLAQSARPLLGTFFLCLIVYALAGGFGSVPSLALMRASVPGEAWDNLLRWRSFATAVLALLGGFFTARLLGVEGLAFPAACSLSLWSS